jgi:hypothetical protein
VNPHHTLFCPLLLDEKWDKLVESLEDLLEEVDIDEKQTLYYQLIRALRASIDCREKRELENASQLKLLKKHETSLNNHLCRDGFCLDNDAERLFIIVLCVCVLVYFFTHTYFTI